MAILLDLPDDLLRRIMGQATFRQQDQAAGTCTRLRRAVDEARRDAALARMHDRDRFIVDEPLPLMTELGMERDETASGAVPSPPPAARVLAAFDRLVPPRGPEGPLRAWYRGAARLAAQGPDAPVYSTGLCGNVEYVGDRDDNLGPEGFGMIRGGDADQDGYVGQWSDAFPQGLGLLIVCPAAAPRAYYHGTFDLGVNVMPGQWAYRRGHEDAGSGLLDRNLWLGTFLDVYTPDEAPDIALLAEVARRTDRAERHLATLGRNRVP